MDACKMQLESSILCNLSSKDCKWARILSLRECNEETTGAKERRLCFCLFACRVSIVGRVVAGYGLSTEASSLKSNCSILTFFLQMRMSTSASGKVRCALVKGGSPPLEASILSSLRLTTLSSSSATSSYPSSSMNSSSTCEEEARAFRLFLARFGGTLV